MNIPNQLTWFFPAALMLFACGSQAVTEDESAIRNVREQSNLAIAAHDTATMAKTLTDDFHIVTSRNFESGKSENLVSLGEDMTAKPDLVYRRTPDEIHVYPQWKMAGEYGTWRGSWTEPNGDKIELTGTYYAKWHKLSDGWKIRAEIFTPLTCTGGVYCEKGPLP
jgi:ketosteroid isomerase-like protein